MYCSVNYQLIKQIGKTNTNDIKRGILSIRLKDLFALKGFVKNVNNYMN